MNNRWLLYHSDFRNRHFKPLCHTSNKRRGRDSNPRDPFGTADLANRCLQPLGHLSKSQGSSIDLTQTKQFYICCMNLYFSSIINITKFLLLYHRKKSNLHNIGFFNPITISLSYTSIIIVQ